MTSTIKRRAVSQRESIQGFVLLDALVAIVIFSVGILGMVALQSSAIQLTTSANYRTNAAMLADQVIAEMWASDPTQLAANYAGTKGAGGAQYIAWLDTVNCASGATASTGCLPGVGANPPSIVVGPGAGPSGNDYLVTVTVSWQAPNDSAPHNYVSITQIGP